MDLLELLCCFTPGSCGKKLLDGCGPNKLKDNQNGLPLQRRVLKLRANIPKAFERK